MFSFREGIKLQYESEETWKETFQDGHATGDRANNRGQNYPTYPFILKAISMGSHDSIDDI